MCFVIFFWYEIFIVSKTLKDATKPQPLSDTSLLWQFQPIYNLPKISVDLEPPKTNGNCIAPEKPPDGVSCQTYCQNTNAFEINISEGETSLASTVLSPGRYCSLTQPQPCSELWGYSVWGLDGWECISKYPELVGGTGAIIPNYSFYNDDTFLSNSLLLDGIPLDTSVPIPADAINDWSRFNLKCTDKVDGFDMVQLPNSFKCVRDPCQTILGTDSRWDNATSTCICGPNQEHRDPLNAASPCIGSNYANIGYDKATTTQYDATTCDSISSQYTGAPINPCPDFGQQVSTNGFLKYKWAARGRDVVPYDSGFTLKKV